MAPRFRPVPNARGSAAPNPETGGRLLVLQAVRPCTQDIFSPGPAGERHAVEPRPARRKRPVGERAQNRRRAPPLVPAVTAGPDRRKRGPATNQGPPGTPGGSPPTPTAHRLGRRRTSGKEAHQAKIQDQHHQGLETSVVHRGPWRLIQARVGGGRPSAPTNPSACQGDGLLKYQGGAALSDHETGSSLAKAPGRYVPPKQSTGQPIHRVDA